VAELWNPIRDLRSGEAPEGKDFGSLRFDLLWETIVTGAASVTAPDSLRRSVVNHGAGEQPQLAA
jgi:hypothetical protein